MQTFQVKVGRAGFEPAKLKTTELQSVLVGRLSISPNVTPNIFKFYIFSTI